MSPAPRRLQSVVDAVRSHLSRRAAVALVLWLVAVAACVMVVAWALAGPDGWRQGSDVPLLLDALVLGAVAAGALVFRRGLRRWFDETPLTRAIEDAAGLRKGMVRGSLELGRSVPVGVSRSLVGLAEERTLQDLGQSGADLSGALGTTVGSWVRRGSGALAAAVVVLIGLAVASPDRASRAWLGLSTPLSIMADPVLPAVVLQPGTVEVLRGSDVEIRVDAQGRFTADLAWQAAGDVARTETLPLSEGVAVHTFANVSATLEYRVRTPDGVETETFRIVPVDPLFVSDLRVEVLYPSHTGVPPEEFRGTVPPLRLPEGTRLLMEGRASRELSRAALADSTGAPALELGVDGVRFQGSWRPRVAGRFLWTFLDDEGAPAAIQPEPLEISLVADSAPSVSIPLPGRDTILPLNLRQPLVLQAQDDYGLRRLELVAYRVTSFGEAQEPVVQGLDLGGTRAALARPLLDVASWGLLPGDEVRYFARAVDNAPTGQTAATREYVLRMPAAGEMQREAQDQLEAMAERLQELAQEAGEQAEETRELQREAAANRDPEERPGGQGQDELGFEEREELRRALEGQEEMAGEVDSLQAELQSLEEALREAGQADPELAAQLEELQELLEQIAGEDMQQRLEEMAEGLDELDAREANQSLDELASEQEDFRERLEESLERFRRAAVEQDFRATESELEELAEMERALADAMREADDPQLRAEQQEAVEERTADMQERMERLEERLQQLGEEDAAREVQEARQQAEQAQQQMSEAQQQAERQQNQDAGEKADEAAEALEEAAEQMQEAQQQMAQEQAKASQEAMRAAADDALALARRQADLSEEMRGASQDRVTEMRGDEASLIQGVRNLAQNLHEATEGAAGQNQELSAQMGRAMESLQKTIEAMENRRGPTPSPAAAAEQAVNDLNQLALMAMASADMSGQQGQGQSGEQTQEQLEQLAQQQGDLTNQTEQLTPLQLGEQAMREQLQQLAQEQQQVADDLQELSGEEGSEEESLGDLEALAEEAQELARQLAEGRLTPETMQRQERLFHRLLDAGRSLEKEEEISDERESTTPGAFERGEVVPLGADALGALRFRLPDADALQRLSPAVRQLVIQYFERLNRGGGSGGGGGS